MSLTITSTNSKEYQSKKYIKKQGNNIGRKNYQQNNSKINWKKKNNQSNHQNPNIDCIRIQDKWILKIDKEYTIIDFKEQFTFFNKMMFLIQILIYNVLKTMQPF